MIVKIGQQYAKQFDIGSYIVILENGNVSSQVQVRSGLKSTAYLNELSSLLNDGIITQFHHDKLVENTHMGTVKDTYFIEDPTIDNSHLDVEEMLQYLDAYQLTAPFESGDTIEEAIQKMIGIGYYFNRITANNL